MDASRDSIPDRAWAVTAGVAGIAGVLSYLPLAALPTSPPLSALLASLFGLGLMLASIALHLGVTRASAPRLSLLAALANAAAVVELMAMVLVQLAVKAAVPHPGRAFIGIWLGLDVAWDVFIGSGTVLFGIALWRHPRFHPLLGLGGVALGALLLVLNIATFPTPPAEAGLVDVGPFVALWYVVLCVWVLVAARAMARPGRRERGSVPGSASVPAPRERAAAVEAKGP